MTGPEVLAWFGLGVAGGILAMAGLWAILRRPRRKRTIRDVVAEDDEADDGD